MTLLSCFNKRHCSVWESKQWGTRRLPRGGQTGDTVYYSTLKSEGQGASAEEVDETIDCLRAEAGEAWLEMNSILYCHALDYQEKMAEFVVESS